MTTEMDQGPGLEPGVDLELEQPGIDLDDPSLVPESFSAITPQPDLSEFESYLDLSQNVPASELTADFVLAQGDPMPEPGQDPDPQADPQADPQPDQEEGPEFDAATTAVLAQLPEAERTRIEEMLVNSQGDLDETAFDSAATITARRTNAIVYRGLVSANGQAIAPAQLNISGLEERMFGAVLTPEQRVTMQRLYQNKEQFLAMFDDEDLMTRAHNLSPRMRGVLLQMKQDLEGPNGANFDQAIRMYQTAATQNGAYVATLQQGLVQGQNQIINNLNEQLERSGSTLRFGTPNNEGMLSINDFPGLGPDALPADMAKVVAGLDLSDEQEAALQQLIGQQYRDEASQFRMDMADLSSGYYNNAAGRTLSTNLQALEQRGFGKVLSKEERHIIMNLMDERDSLSDLVADNAAMTEMARNNPQLHRVVLAVNERLNGQGGDALYTLSQQYRERVTGAQSYQGHLADSFRNFQNDQLTGLNRSLQSILGRGSQATFTAAPRGTMGPPVLNPPDQE